MDKGITCQKVGKYSIVIIAIGIIGLLLNIFTFFYEKDMTGGYYPPNEEFRYYLWMYTGITLGIIGIISAVAQVVLKKVGRFQNKQLIASLVSISCIVMSLIFAMLIIAYKFFLANLW